MQQVKIYIETDSSSPKATEKHYGYVLEVMISGQAVTREGFGKITGTYHQTVLTALAKALDRFNQSCEVCICTEDDFVLNMLERNLAIWAGNEFLTSKRKPVANQQEWMEIWRLSNRHLILTEPGKHEYTGWLQGEIESERGTMMEYKITIMKYQLMFPKMTKKLFDEKERIYQITVICIRLDELQTKGAVLQKMGKPTKNGTKMTFAPVRSAGEYEAEMQRILEDGKKLGMKFEDKEEE